MSPVYRVNQRNKRTDSRLKLIAEVPLPRSRTFYESSPEGEFRLCSPERFGGYTRLSCLRQWNVLYGRFIKTKRCPLKDLIIVRSSTPGLLGTL
jgi:hypothetical protein